ncbi:MAG TPA: BatA domain-containing protein [Bryobacteraceae bacterium]|jgi:hypothetical protein|nr:BatA domain-containing protein [Bryobacteraceae bacterium]
MGFLAPWFLAGIAAVGLPVWLHLLKKHRSDPRYFPSLMLFEKREVSSVKHRRLEHLLLFALRAAMLILLALLFANPFIRRAIPIGGQKHLTLIAIDDSFSMRAGNRLQQAKDQAQSILSSVRPGDPVQVVALGAQIQTLTQPTTDPGEARAAINSIQPTDSRASFGELARYSRTLAESIKSPIELNLVSDLQRSAMPPGFADLRLEPGTNLVLHQVGDAAPNWTVESVTAPRRVYDPKKVRIQAIIAGFGAPAAKRTVSLLLNGKSLQTKTVDVAENGRAQVEFLGLDAPYGFSRGEVRIDSADILAADDHYDFAVERADPKKILFVDDGRHPRAELYYKAALDASPDSAFTLETLRPDQAANAKLGNYALIVLSDLGALPGGFEDSLKAYVAAGGSLLIALGPASAASPRVPVLDEAIQSSSYAHPEGQMFLSVSDLDTGDPVMRDLERFDGVKFYQAIRVTSAKSRVLARLNDGTPLVLEQAIGEGKVMAFASTFDNTANDLPLHAAWVPFVQRSAEYLGGEGGDQPVNVTADSYIELRASGDKTGAAEVLLDGRRLLSLEEAAAARNFAVHKEGFYEVKTASGRRSLIAVHADRRESDLAVIPKETLDLWKATGSDENASGASASVDQGDKKPWGLWPILLLILLGVAIAESIVADRHLKPPAAAEKTKRKEAA